MDLITEALHPCATNPSYFAHKCCGQAPAYGDHNYHAYDGRVDLPGRGFYCITCHKAVSVMNEYVPFALMHWNMNTPKGGATYTAGELNISIPQWGSMFEASLYQVVIEDTSRKGAPTPKSWGVNASCELKDAILINPDNGATVIADVSLGNYWNLPGRVLIQCNGARTQRKTQATLTALKQWLENK